MTQECSQDIFASSLLITLFHDLFFSFSFLNGGCLNSKYDIGAGVAAVAAGKFVDKKLKLDNNQKVNIENQRLGRWCRSRIIRRWSRPGRNFKGFGREC